MLSCQGHTAEPQYHIFAQLDPRISYHAPRKDLFRLVSPFFYRPQHLVGPALKPYVNTGKA